MSEDTIKNDLEKHPNLSPIMDVDTRGNVVCLGWISPIFTWDDVPNFERDVLGLREE